MKYKDWKTQVLNIINIIITGVWYFLNEKGIQSNRNSSFGNQTDT